MPREASPRLERRAFTTALASEPGVQDLDHESDSSSSSSSPSAGSARASPTKRTWDDRLVARVRALSEGLGYSTIADKEEVGKEAHSMELDTMDEAVAKPLVEVHGVTIDESGADKPSETGVKCLVAKYTRLNTQLGSLRERAWASGNHLWVLLQAGELVTPEGFMPPGVPRCQPRQVNEGYHLQCWTCGITFPTARLKSVSKFLCSYSGLAAGKPLSAVGKVHIHRRVWPLFAEWLRGQNALASRRALHWPILLAGEREGDDQSDNYRLRCTKCGLCMEHARKAVMMNSKCKSKRTTEVLIAKEEHEQNKSILDVVRGGNFKVGSLNVGAATDKQYMLSALECQILLLQETSVPESKWGSYRSTMRDLNGDIVFGPVRQQDTVLRGRQAGCRLGTGVAVACFGPWRLRPPDGHFVQGESEHIAGHRVVTALASCAESSIVCHSVYYPPDQNQDVVQAIDSILYSRIVSLPHAHHVIGGDWQADIDTCSFGSRLRDLGWTPHGALSGYMPTNTPAFGTCRRLDEIWFSPNMKSFLIAAQQYPIPEASTHDLLEVTCTIEIPSKLITIAARPMSSEVVQDKTAKACEDVWLDPPSASATEYYRWWRNQVCLWLRVPQDSLGMPRSYRREAYTALKAPVRPRALYRQNLARKVSLWLQDVHAVSKKGCLAYSPTSCRWKTL